MAILKGRNGPISVSSRSGETRPPISQARTFPYVLHGPACNVGGRQQRLAAKPVPLSGATMAICVRLDVTRVSSYAKQFNRNGNTIFRKIGPSLIETPPLAGCPRLLVLAGKGAGGAACYAARRSDAAARKIIRSADTRIASRSRREPGRAGICSAV